MKKSNTRSFSVKFKTELDKILSKEEHEGGEEEKKMIGMKLIQNEENIKYYKNQSKNEEKLVFQYEKIKFDKFEIALVKTPEYLPFETINLVDDDNYIRITENDINLSLKIQTDDKYYVYKNLLTDSIKINKDNLTSFINYLLFKFLETNYFLFECISFLIRKNEIKEFLEFVKNFFNQEGIRLTNRGYDFTEDGLIKFLYSNFYSIKKIYNKYNLETKNVKIKQELLGKEADIEYEKAYMKVNEEVLEKIQQLKNTGDDDGKAKLILDNKKYIENIGDLKKEILKLKGIVKSTTKELDKYKGADNLLTKEGEVPPEILFRRQLIKIYIKKHLYKKMFNIKFSSICAGYLQLRDEQPFLIVNIEQLLYKRVLKNPTLTEDFFEQQKEGNNIKGIEEKLNEIIKKEEYYFENFIKEDARDPIMGGEIILTPNLVAAREMAWNHIYNALLIAREMDPRGGFEKFPDSIDPKSNMPSMRFLYTTSNKGENKPPLLYSFCRLTSAYLTKSEDIQKIKIGTRYDKIPIDINLKSAQLDMRLVLSQHGFSVNRDIYKDELYSKYQGGGFQALSNINRNFSNNSNRSNFTKRIKL